jgi:hypothetical protein
MICSDFPRGGVLGRKRIHRRSRRDNLGPRCFIQTELAESFQRERAGVLQTGEWIDEWCCSKSPGDWSPSEVCRRSLFGLPFPVLVDCLIQMSTDDDGVQGGPRPTFSGESRRKIDLPLGRRLDSWVIAAGFEG